MELHLLLPIQSLGFSNIHSNTPIPSIFLELKRKAEIKKTETNKLYLKYMNLEPGGISKGRYIMNANNDSQIL